MSKSGSIICNMLCVLQQHGILECYTLLRAQEMHFTDSANQAIQIAQFGDPFKCDHPPAESESSAEQELSTTPVAPTAQDPKGTVTAEAPAPRPAPVKRKRGRPNKCPWSSPLKADLSEMVEFLATTKSTLMILHRVISADRLQLVSIPFKENGPLEVATVMGGDWAEFDKLSKCLSQSPLLVYNYTILGLYLYIRNRRCQEKNLPLTQLYETSRIYEYGQAH